MAESGLGMHPLMSAFGHKRTLSDELDLSALALVELSLVVLACRLVMRQFHRRSAVNPCA